jgi:hypothetical protein
MDQKKWERMTRVAQGMYGFECAPMETQDYYEN